MIPMRFRSVLARIPILRVPFTVGIIPPGRRTISVGHPVLLVGPLHLNHYPVVLAVGVITVLPAIAFQSGVGARHVGGIPALTALDAFVARFGHEDGGVWIARVWDLHAFSSVEQVHSLFLVVRAGDVGDGLRDAVLLVGGQGGVLGGVRRCPARDGSARHHRAGHACGRSGGKRSAWLNNMCLNIETVKTEWSIFHSCCETIGNDYVLHAETCLAGYYISVVLGQHIMITTKWVILWYVISLRFVTFVLFIGFTIITLGY